MIRKTVTQPKCIRVCSKNKLIFASIEITKPKLLEFSRGNITNIMFSMNYLFIQRYFEAKMQPKYSTLSITAAHTITKLLSHVNDKVSFNWKRDRRRACFTHVAN